MHRNDFENRARAKAGGKVASYKIERRERPDGAWAIAGMAMESEINLHNQDRGKEWGYRTCRFGRPWHVSKASQGMPSNTDMAVLQAIC